MSDLHNPAPILSIREVVLQLENNLQYFKSVQSNASPKKLTTQIKPTPAQMPMVGVSIEFGDVSENFANSTMAQILNIDVCCTVVQQTAQDLTGSQTQSVIFDTLLKDLMHSLYNWQPEQDRYTNGFKLTRFERIEALCDNEYEVYCVWFTIPLQIDYLDGYLSPEVQLKEIQSQVILDQINSLTIINKSK